MKKSFTITVITKLITPNAGNQALSTELIRLIKSAYPEARTYAGWQERGLERYSFAMLQHGGSNPLNTLDGWAERIIKKYDASRNGNSIGNEEALPILKTYELYPDQEDFTKIVKLNSHIPSLPLRLYNKGLRNLSTLLDRRGVYGKKYENWLDVLKYSDWVVYSPAGAILGSLADVIVRDLLGLRIAQRLGARIAAVNQSVEINHPLLQRLLSQLYTSFDSIVVRDPASAEFLAKAGVSPVRIKLAPDTAYLSQPANMETHDLDQIIKLENIKPRTVGITLQAIKNRVDFSGWGRIIEILRSQGKEVIFVSHEMATDMPSGKELQKRYNVKILSRQYNYGEYIRLLSLLELVISERYHTCVFSTIAGIPFIPLNTWPQRKMHGIVWALNYPIPPVNTFHDDWVDLTLKNIEYLYQNYDQIAESLREALPRLRKLAEENVRYDSVSASK